MIEYEYNDGRRDWYRWTCDNCGRSRLIQEGEDVAWRECEFENEGRR